MSEQAGGVAELVALSDQLIIEEARRRSNEQKMIPRKCRGCGRMFGAREMREHACKVGWTKRLPFKFDSDQNRYVLR